MPWSGPPPWSTLATNLTTLAGDHTARLDGLTSALLATGVGRGEPVMLAGHSQGGLLAARAAQEYARPGSRFTVTQLVTAGAPIDRIGLPPTVQVLSLINRRDVVPRLDGQPDPDTSRRTTVTFAAERGSLGANHGLPTYVAAAGALPRDAPALAAWWRGAADVLPPAGRPVTVTDRVFDIEDVSRRPPDPG